MTERRSVCVGGQGAFRVTYLIHLESRLPHWWGKVVIKFCSLWLVGRCGPSFFSLWHSPNSKPKHGCGTLTSFPQLSWTLASIATIYIFNDKTSLTERTLWCLRESHPEVYIKKKLTLTLYQVICCWPRWNDRSIESEMIRWSDLA